MPHMATIESLPVAFEMVKAMQADGLDWGEGYRPLGRQALEEIIEHLYRAEVSALMLSMANPRHEHEYHSLQRHQLPPGMKLIVGAIDSTTMSPWATTLLSER